MTVKDLHPALFAFLVPVMGIGQGPVIVGLVLLLVGVAVLLAVSGDGYYDDGCYCY